MQLFCLSAPSPHPVPVPCFLSLSFVGPSLLMYFLFTFLKQRSTKALGRLGGESLGWGVAVGWQDGGRPGSCQAGGSLDEQVESVCAGRRRGRVAEPPAGPGGKAFELLAWGRRRAWANLASHSPFSNQLETVDCITRENKDKCVEDWGSGAKEICRVQVKINRPNF